MKPMEDSRDMTDTTKEGTNAADGIVLSPKIPVYGRYTIWGILLVVLFALNIFLGSVSIPPVDILQTLTGRGANDTLRYIIFDSRLPQAVTSAVTGAGLSVSGLMLQTAFHNPLAGPSVLGISSGASLGVALVMLASGGALATGCTTSIGGYALVIASALCGAMAVTGLLLAMAAAVRNNLILLIAGMMTGYLISSVITLLTYNATAQGIQTYVVWGMGDFSLVTTGQMPWYALVILISISCCMPLVKPLNAMQLGTSYAESLGISVRRLRRSLLLTTGIITAVTTAFCGPISFLGLAVPHIVRMVTRTDNFRRLMPMTVIAGAVAALSCNILSTAITPNPLPLAAITPVIGAPVILWVIFKRR